MTSNTALENAENVYISINEEHIESLTANTIRNVSLHQSSFVNYFIDCWNGWMPLTGVQKNFGLTCKTERNDLILDKLIWRSLQARSPCE